MNPLSMITGGFITPTIAIATQQVAQVPLSPSQAQSLLVKSLELPLPTSLTNGYGIFQSDVIIRTALIAAIADIRANPWLLKYCFASLPKDKLTLADYGEQEVQRAIDWFTATDIPVIIQPRVDTAKLPCISVQLVESSEGASTVGDIHYEPNQDTDTENWPIYFGPFRPKTYTPVSGFVTLDPDQAAGFTLQEGQVIVDSTGKSYPILEVIDDSSFYIASGVVADFTTATIRPGRPAYVSRLESVEFKETYNIGCHVLSEPVHLTYLHSIIVFCLLRYKEALLDPRGLERTTISSSDPQHNGNYGKDNVFSRFVMLTGYVRHYWPSGVDPKIGSVTVEVTECTTPNAIVAREQLASAPEPLPPACPGFGGACNIDADCCDPNFPFCSQTGCTNLGA